MSFVRAAGEELSLDTVNANAATPWQLMVLLDLSREEVERVLVSRPFSSVEAFRAVLPAEHAGKVEGLELPKLNINATTAETLVRVSGVPEAVAENVLLNRPFYFMSQIRTLLDLMTFEAIDSVFTTPALVFVDKLRDQRVKLNADPTQVLVSRSESEGFSNVADRFHLEPVYPDSTGGPYEVLSVPETESATDILGELQRGYGRNVLPAYTDEQSSRRYLNPRFCTVQFRPDISEARHHEIIGQLGLSVQESHRTDGLYTLEIPGARDDPLSLSRALDALNALSDVRFAEPNYLGFDDHDSFGLLGEATTELSGESDDPPWHLRLIRAPDALSTGQPSSDVVLAVIDSGVDSGHPALSGGLVHRGPGDNWNFSVDDNPDPIDKEGHGTFIAGLLVGNGAQGVRGVCPGCSVLPLKVPLNGEVTSYARRRDAILYALERISPPRRLIINLSWKTAGDVGVIRDAVETAALRGALVVASAGNRPQRENEPHYPSDYPSVISVAAVGATSRRTNYSFWGDEIDISAPGGEGQSPETAITSAAPGGRVATDIGTSFAAPHVAGVAALVASVAPQLDAQRVRFILEDSTRPLEDSGMGKGLCDALGAVGSALGQAPATDGLTAVNTLDTHELIHKFQLLPLTAKLLVAKRPFLSLEDLRGTLGLTDAQFTCIASA